MLNRYLLAKEHIYAVTRITDLLSMIVERWKSLKDMGQNAISIGVESGDNWTLERIRKGCHIADLRAVFRAG